MQERIYTRGDYPERLLVTNYEQVREVASLYASVFAGEPWNEYATCACGKFFGRESCIGGLCPSGKSTLTPAYPLEETVEYITTECGRDSAQSFIQRDGVSGKMIGFSWGYPINSVSEFVQDKYATSDMQDSALLRLNQYDITGDFFYFSEIGVREDWRGRGISTILSRKLIDAAMWLSLPIVMRTNSKSPLMAVARNFGMTQILGPETTISESMGVKTIEQTGRYVNNTIDSENGDRVLFVLK